MRIVLKHTLKNIFRKPFRTLLVVFCLFVCSFVALVSLDMSGSLEQMFKGFFSSNIGKTDISVTVNDRDLSFLEDKDLPEYDALDLYALPNKFMTDIEGEYTFVRENTVNIYGVDIEHGKDFAFYNYSDDLKDDEIVISSNVASYLGLKEGSVMTVHDESGEVSRDLTVRAVAKKGDKGILSSDGAIVTENTILQLMSDPCPQLVMIDIKDDALIKDAVDMLEDRYPSETFQSVMQDDNLVFMINVITKLTVVMFAVCVLMVIFVTISVSERIISERMSVVGTLRSVGVSASTTAFILLLENAFYGIIGSVLGCLLYSAIRVPFLVVFIGSEEWSNDFGTFNPLFYLLVIVSAVLIECLTPLKEIIRATNTPIRDLIFMNKDTEYRFSRFGTVAGIACLLIATIIFFLPTGFYLSLIQFGLYVFALSLLYPYIQYAGGKLIYRLFEKRDNPIGRLAATEVFTKKSTIGASVLISTSVALTLVIYLIAVSLINVIASDRFHATNYVTTTGDKNTAYFEYIADIDGVSDVEFVYEKGDTIKINGVEETVNVFGFPEGGYRHFTALQEVPPLRDDEISVTDILGRELGLKVGDEVEVEFLSDSYYPAVRKMKVAKFCDSSRFDVSGTIVAVTEKLDKELYGDYPASIYFNAEDPDSALSIVDKYSKSYIDKNYTGDTFKEDSKKAQSALLTLIYVGIAFGAGITFIGAVSNILIGFEGRKRECAVLASTSMPRKKINRLFFLESVFSSALALIAAVPAGLFLVYPVKAAFASMSMNLITSVDPVPFTVIALALWFFFMLTSRFPMRALRKMKLAEQLKYE